MNTVIIVKKMYVSCKHMHLMPKMQINVMSVATLLPIAIATMVLAQCFNGSLFTGRFLLILSIMTLLYKINICPTTSVYLFYV